MSKKKPKSLFTVRGKKHERHPQVIVGASRTQFESLSITHSKKHGRVNNIPLDGNPQEGKKDPSYVEKKKAIKDFKTAREILCKQEQWFRLLTGHYSRSPEAPLQAIPSP